jgi:hypothetical protein
MVRPWRPVSKHLVRRWCNHGVLLFGSGAFPTLILRGSSIAVAFGHRNSRFGLLKVLRSLVLSWRSCCSICCAMLYTAPFILFQCCGERIGCITQMRHCIASITRRNAGSERQCGRTVSVAGPALRYLAGCSFGWVRRNADRHAGLRSRAGGECGIRASATVCFRGGFDDQGRVGPERTMSRLWLRVSEQHPKGLPTYQES